MLKHIVFFLYLLSFTSGIGAITLGFFLYKQTVKSKALQYILYADLCLTVSLVLNTLNYYQTLLPLMERDYFLIILVYGLLFSALGRILFYSLTVNELLGKPFSPKMKLSHILAAASALALTAVLHSLAVLGFMRGDLAAHTGCLTATLTGTAGTAYNSLRLLKNQHSLAADVKPLAKAVSVVALTITLLALASDILSYTWQHDFPIAFSPLSYFILNAIALSFALRHYWGQRTENRSPVYALTAAPEPADYQAFCQAYDITARELEIILLLTKGNTNQEIGDKLFISLHTVRNHIYNIYRKVGVSKRRELIQALNASLLQNSTQSTGHEPF